MDEIICCIDIPEFALLIKTPLFYEVNSLSRNWLGISEIFLLDALETLQMVFCYQNCSDLLWEKVELVVEKNLWDSRLNNLFKQWNVRTILLTCSWRFLMSNKLEQLEFRKFGKKILGFRNMQEKLEESQFSCNPITFLWIPNSMHFMQRDFLCSTE